jgi:hypothetical protein
MKASLWLTALVMLTGCNLREMLVPKTADEELLGGKTAITSQFPSGCWDDGLGNAWSVNVKSDSVAGTSASAGADDLSITGQINGSALSYRVADPGEAQVWFGTATLVDTQHAAFQTLDASGTLSAHGLLHFNHSAQSPTREPAALKPVADCATHPLEGD